MVNNPFNEYDSDELDEFLKSIPPEPVTTTGFGDFTTAAFDPQDVEAANKLQALEPMAAMDAANLQPPEMLQYAQDQEELAAQKEDDFFGGRSNLEGVKEQLRSRRGEDDANFPIKLGEYSDEALQNWYASEGRDVNEPFGPQTERVPTTMFESKKDMMPQASPSLGDAKPASEYSKEDLLKQVRKNLLNRAMATDPAKIERERTEKLKEAEPGLGREIASVVGSALMGGAGKVAFANLDEQTRKKKEAIEKKYNLKQDQLIKDVEALGELDRKELDAALKLEQIDDAKYKNSVNRKAFSDAKAAADPNSEQSKFAQQVVFDGLGMKTKLSAKEIGPSILGDASAALKLKATVGVRMYEAQQKEMYKAQYGQQKEASKLEAKQKERATLPTEAEKTMDREFAKKYSDYMSQRGDISVNRKKLTEVVNSLGSGPNQVDTGTFGGIKTAVGEKAGVLTEEAELKSKARSAIQGMLRPILGGQFAMIEGENIINTAFDPRRSTKANKEAIQDEIKKLDNRVAIFEDQADYYNKNRTLAGYEPPKGFNMDGSTKTEEKKVKIPVKPGQEVKSGGKRYRVGPDGKTLTPLD
jgi:hypothetical protein